MLVHCDPRFARLEETFKPSTPLRVPVHYTGFVTGRNGTAPATRGEHIVVSAGGGRVGAPLLRGGDGSASDGRPMRAIAGPLMPDEDYERAPATASPRNVELVRSVPDLAHGAAAAPPASISQCGYNTALDLLRTRVPALVVPYATPEEDEQTRRARRLQQLGARAGGRRTSTATSTRCSTSRPRPPRSTSTAPRTTRGAAPMSTAPRVLRPYVLASGARCSARAPSTGVSPPPSWPSRGRSR